jgi:hypothetical protein
MPNNNLIPLDWDEDAIRLLSLIAPDDPDKARIWWETYAPVAYEAILDAGILDDRDDLPRTDEEFERWLGEQMDDGEGERKRRWWALGILFFFTSWRYITMDNDTVPPSQVRAILDRTLANARNDMRALCDSLRGGGLSLADWQVRMTDLIKTIHMAAAVLARGGFGRMSPDDWARVQDRIREQISYLDNFASQIASGQQRLDGTLCRRMLLYLEAGRGTYHDIERNLMEDRGYDEFRNRITASESCSECIEMSDMGWVPIDSSAMVPIGSRICNKNCKCYYEYRISETAT